MQLVRDVSVGDAAAAGDEWGIHSFVAAAAVVVAAVVVVAATAGTGWPVAVVPLGFVEYAAVGHCIHSVSEQIESGQFHQIG